jgi:excisionase family DNA binding protein
MSSAPDGDDAEADVVALASPRLLESPIVESKKGSRRDTMPGTVSELPGVGMPTEADARLARDSVEQLSRILETRDAEFPFQLRFRFQPDGDREETVTLPLPALRLLKDILDRMARGQGVTVVSLPDELTSQQAADLLNVTRPYLIGLLEEGKIPSRLEGNHRRIRLDDLLAYKRQDDEKRLEVLGELVAQAQELDMGY